MTKIISLHSTIRVISILLVASVATVLLLCQSDFSLPQDLFFSAAAGCLICLIFPTSCGNMSLSMWYSLSVAAVMVFAVIVKIPSVLVVVVEQILLVLYLVIAGLAGVTNLEKIICENVAWKGVEIYSKLFYVAVYLVLLSLGQLLIDSVWLWCCSVMSVTLYLVLYSRDYFAITLFVPGSVEKRIRMLDRRDSSGHQGDVRGEKSKLSIVYDRAYNAVESKKLYLQPKYSLGDLSKEVFCNKTFLSRAINAYSGNGFCYFMNVFRINYARGILEKDQRILMKELAYMCGFSNIVTFNMAFKAVTGKTPTEHLDEIKADQLRLSRRMEPEL